MKVILVDDEPLALEFLELQLEKVSNFSILGKFINLEPRSHEDLIKSIDVAFLDINLPNMHGTSLATKLLDINPSLFIIFVTAHNDFATEAFELKAFDYILKPIQLKRLKTTCDRIVSTSLKDSEVAFVVDKALQICVSTELKIKLLSGTIERPVWRTSKIKELFLYLLHNNGINMLKSELAELLWPGVLPEKSYARLYTAIYHIRKTLKQYKENLTIKSSEDGYTLQLINASVDLFLWEQEIKRLGKPNIFNIDNFEEIMRLYDGPYLDKYDYVWAEADRYRLEQLWYDYAQLIAEFHVQQESLQHAANWYVAISNVRPEDEKTTFKILKIFSILGSNQLVTHYYKRLEVIMNDMDLKPHESISNWFKDWSKSTTSLK